MTFDIDVRHNGDSCRLLLSGELDLDTVPRFEGAIHAACDEGARTITVDLGRITFIDSTGLRAILDGHQFCFAHRIDYWVDPTMSRPVKRLLEIAGVGQLPFAKQPLERESAP